jgi:hypothetical protein
VWVKPDRGVKTLPLGKFHGLSTRSEVGSDNDSMTYVRVNSPIDNLPPIFIELRKLKMRVRID